MTTAITAACRYAARFTQFTVTDPQLRRKRRNTGPDSWKCRKHRTVSLWTERQTDKRHTSRIGPSPYLHDARMQLASTLTLVVSHTHDAVMRDAVT